MTPIPTITPSYENVILHRVRVGCGARLGDGFASHMALESWADQFAQGIVHQFTSEVLQEKREVSSVTTTDATEEVPLTWWDALIPSLRKAMPTFCRRLRPRIRTVATSVTKTTVTEVRTCPHLDATGNDPHVRFMAWLPEGGAHGDAERLDAWRSVEAERKFRERWEGRGN